ncbi:hypothetical protein IPM62_01505 [Candidatus Woesebacteria bacterium]|nr:MAG: hypothetical protein IPM62_01505 [Candidatus Woesebacteria bacterium]
MRESGDPLTPLQTQDEFESTHKPEVSGTASDEPETENTQTPVPASDNTAQQS